MICRHQADLLSTRELTQQAPVDEDCHEVLSRRLDTSFYGIQKLRKEGEEDTAEELADAVEEHIINRSPPSVHQRAVELERERGYV